MNILLESSLILLMALFFHELTHYIYARWTDNFIKVDFDDWSPTIHFDDKMSSAQQLCMYILAIIAGLFVIIPFIFLSENGSIHVITLLIYLVGCQYDITQIIHILFYTTTAVGITATPHGLPISM